MASKNAQGSVWNRAAGDWEQIYEPQRVPLYEKILDACGVESGTRMLDAGCGSGGLSLRASLRGARVSGFDISEEMVARAQAKVTDGEYRVGELNAPPFDKGTFDTIIACECMFLAPDPVDAVRKLSRVCKSNGKVAIAVFGPADSSDQSRMFASMYAVMPEPPKILLLSLSDEGVLEDLFAKAGLRTEAAHALPCSYRFDSFDAFWNMMRNFAGIQSLIGAVGEEKICAAALAGAMPSIDDAGELRFNNVYRLVVARENIAP